MVKKRVVKRKPKKRVVKKRPIKKVKAKKRVVKKKVVKVKRKPAKTKKRIIKRRPSSHSRKKVKKRVIRKKRSNKSTKRKTVKKKTIKKVETQKGRIPTGIESFDKLISGGFVTNSVNLIEGGSGTGKSIFAMQYLLEGIKNGESVLYVTFEEKKENFYSNMKKLGWDLEMYEKQKKFIFLEYSPEKIKMMIDEGGGSIESLVLRHNIKRIVIDSITSFTLLFDTDLQKRGAALGLFDVIRKWNCTTLLIVQHDPLKEEKEDISLLEYEVDGVVLLYFKKGLFKRKRSLEVIKMRGTYHSTQVHIFEIDQGIIVKGIERSPRRRKK